MSKVNADTYDASPTSTQPTYTLSQISAEGIVLKLLAATSEDANDPDEVFNRLQPALNAVWGGQVTFDRRDEIISVTHDKTIYDIGLSTDTAVIAYELQRQFNVTA